MLKPARKHHFHVSTRTPTSLQNDLQKGALGSQFGTENGKSALQEVIEKKHENIYRKMSKNIEKVSQNWTNPP